MFISLYFVLARASCEEGQNATSPGYVALFLDHSGSIADTDDGWNKTLDFAGDYVRLSSNKTKISIMMFSFGIEVINDYTRNKKDILDALDKRRGNTPVGGTNIVGVMQTYAEQRATFENTTNSTGDPILIIVTDGVQSEMRADGGDELSEVLSNSSEAIRNNDSGLILVLVGNDTISTSIAKDWTGSRNNSIFHLDNYDDIVNSTTSIVKASCGDPLPLVPIVAAGGALLLLAIIASVLCCCCVTAGAGVVAKKKWNEEEEGTLEQVFSNGPTPKPKVIATNTGMTQSRRPRPLE